VLPVDAKARKGVPLFSGPLSYFPDALCAVAELCRIGNEQHNPGQPLHWARGKSTDQLDCLARHLLECGTTDIDGVLHDTKVAWRALANLQLRLEDPNYDRRKDCDHPANVASGNYPGHRAGQVDRLVSRDAANLVTPTGACGAVSGGTS